MRVSKALLKSRYTPSTALPLSAAPALILSQKVSVAQFVHAISVLADPSYLFVLQVSENGFQEDLFHHLPSH